MQVKFGKEVHCKIQFDFASARPKLIIIIEPMGPMSPLALNAHQAVDKYEIVSYLKFGRVQIWPPCNK